MALAELIDQIKFTPNAEYVFRHPLIRAVAYESQLKADRATLHRRLATEIEQRNPDSTDENAALIAEHLEAAGDLDAAYGWHMRAGTWSTNRDIVAAHTSWTRARHVADRLPGDDTDRLAKQIAPRTLLSATAFRVGGSGAETGFEELRNLCAQAGDKRSLAIGMTGLVAQRYEAHSPEASAVATEHIGLLESIGDPALTVGLVLPALAAKIQTLECTEVLRTAEHVIALANGDPTMGNLIFGSPLALGLTFRGCARWCLGLPGWRDDCLRAIDMAQAVDATTFALTVFFLYCPAVPWVVPADETALAHTADALAQAERSGDDLALNLARSARAAVLLHKNGPDYGAGLALFREIRDTVLGDQFSHSMLGYLDAETASVKFNCGDLDGAIDSSRTAIDGLYPSGEGIWAQATACLVEALLQRDAAGDIEAAQAAIERLAEVPTPPGVIVMDMHEVRLRALLARAMGDESRYREFRDRYRTMATSLGYHGHIAAAEALT